MADYTHSDQGPKCPYCSWLHNGDEHNSLPVNGSYELECNGCGKKFIIDVSTTTSWTGRKIEKPAVQLWLERHGSTGIFLKGAGASGRKFVAMGKTSPFSEKAILMLVSSGRATRFGNRITLKGGEE